MEMHNFVHMARRKSQRAFFFWPIAEGALLKWCHVHKVYSETSGINLRFLKVLGSYRWCTLVFPSRELACFKSFILLYLFGNKTKGSSNSLYLCREDDKERSVLDVRGKAQLGKTHVIRWGLKTHMQGLRLEVGFEPGSKTQVKCWKKQLG